MNSNHTTLNIKRDTLMVSLFSCPLSGYTSPPPQKIAECFEANAFSSKHFLRFPCGKHTVSYRKTYSSHSGTIRFRDEKHKKMPEVSEKTFRHYIKQILYSFTFSSGAYSCKVNSPRSTPKAFMTNAPISSSPGITTIGARPSSHSRKP